MTSLNIVHQFLYDQFRLAILCAPYVSVAYYIVFCMVGVIITEYIYLAFLLLLLLLLSNVAFNRM